MYFGTLYQEKPGAARINTSTLGRPGMPRSGSREEANRCQWQPKWRAHTLALWWAGRPEQARSRPGLWPFLPWPFQLQDWPQTQPQPALGMGDSPCNVKYKEKYQAKKLRSCPVKNCWFSDKILLFHLQELQVFCSNTTGFPDKSCECSAQKLLVCQVKNCQFSARAKAKVNCYFLLKYCELFLYKLLVFCSNVASCSNKNRYFSARILLVFTKQVLACCSSTASFSCKNCQLSDKILVVVSKNCEFSAQIL